MFADELRAGLAFINQQFRFRRFMGHISPLAVLSGVADFLADGVPPGSRNTRTRCPSARSVRQQLTCVDLPQPSVPSNVMKQAFH